MTIVRQLERQWEGRRYRALLADLLAARVEAAFLPRLGSGSLAAPAAAIGIIRLNELGLLHVGLYRRLLQTLIASQLPDGSWGEPAVTALCLRALLSDRTAAGLVIDRAIEHLADLQRADGAWPEIPLRRLPGDAATTAFILLELADDRRFADCCDVPGALAWLEGHAVAGGAMAIKLADSALRRLAPRKAALLPAVAMN